jgi:hypothetical protein
MPFNTITIQEPPLESCLSHAVTWSLPALVIKSQGKSSVRKTWEPSLQKNLFLMRHTGSCTYNYLMCSGQKEKFVTTSLEEWKYPPRREFNLF